MLEKQDQEQSKSESIISNQHLEIITIQLNMVKDITVNYGYYKDIYQSLDELKCSRKFWIVACNNCLSTAFTTWCKLFGEKNNNDFHVSNVAIKLSIDINCFYDEIYEKYEFESKTMQKYTRDIIRFRNKYFSHTDQNFEMPVPHFEKACLIAINYFNWISQVLLDKYAVLNESKLNETLQEFFTDIHDLIETQKKAEFKT